MSRVILHVVWATLDRCPSIEPTLDPTLERILRRLALEQQALVHAFGAACDHVHVLVQLPSVLSVAGAVQRMKGASSHALGCRLLGGWQAGYWVESVSPDGIAPVSTYVQAQRDHHASSRPLEPWEMEPADRRA
jgi:REP element-mobilizing transposase RayT